MALLPKIDRAKTKKEADSLLKCYRSFARLADEEFVPKVTATYSFELKSYTGTVSKAVENAVIRKVATEQEVIKISKAINKLNAYDRQLIYDKYMNRTELSDIAIYLDYGLSESQFYRQLEDVLVKFSEAYEGGKLLFWEMGD